MPSSWTAGIARRKILPPPGVELAGLGYYLNRTWERVRDDLNATALVIGNSKGNSAVLIALDLMYNDSGLTHQIRSSICAATGIPAESICVNVSHSHNAPTAGFIRGAGEVDPDYVSFVAQEGAAAAISAFRSQKPAALRVGHSHLKNMTFNRARENGPTDTRVSVLRLDHSDGRPLAVAVNFHSHCIAYMEADMRAVTRDWPGDMVDQIEAALPGVMAMYLQGTCGDVNFRRDFNGTDRRAEPGRAVTRAALEAFANARPVTGDGIASNLMVAQIPTRRWSREEIARDREEGLYRLRSGDTTDWLSGLARVIVGQPERLPLRYGGSVEKAVAAISRFAVEWTDDILPHLDSRPEYLGTEVQALRIGDVWFVSNPAELFASLGLGLRESWPHPELFMFGYSNGTIGYMPDAHDVERRTYAALQSPKFMGQFPFTSQSGAALVQGMLTALEKTSDLD